MKLLEKMIQKKTILEVFKAGIMKVYSLHIIRLSEAAQIERERIG